MSAYRLPHDLAGERQRLALMSALLDPVEQVTIDGLGVGPGWRCLELGSGNGSIARILAQRVGPNGHVVASDIDLSFMAGLERPNLEVRRIDVLQDEMEEGAYDLVAARALLHHLPGRKTALERMINAVKPGGAFLSIEPDMLPATVVEPDSMRLFWQAWLGWSAESGIDYTIGRRVPAWLDSLGLRGVGGEGHSAHFCGGSDWARYWVSTLRELAPSLLKSGFITTPMLDDCYAHFEDPHYWTSLITFTATWGRKPA